MGFIRGQQFLPDIRWVPDHHVETALLEDFRKDGVPVDRFRVNGRIGNDAVADADRMVQTRERLPALGRFDPQAEPANLDRFFVQINAVQVVFENPLVQVEERPMAAQLGQPVVRPLIGCVQLGFVYSLFFSPPSQGGDGGVALRAGKSDDQPSTSTRPTVPNWGISRFTATNAATSPYGRFAGRPHVT